MIAGDDHFLRVAQDSQVGGFVAVRDILRGQVGLDDPQPGGRGTQDPKIVEGHSRAKRRIGPCHQVMDVIELGFAPVRDLLGDLHHPVGCALAKGGRKDVVAPGLIAREHLALETLGLNAGEKRAHDPSLEPAEIIQKACTRTQGTEKLLTLTRRNSGV